jgi:hypothetical protein
LYSKNKYPYSKCRLICDRFLPKCFAAVISRDLISEIAVIVATFPKLTRTELANTICELFSWKRPTGKLKTVECRQFLERLDARGIIQASSVQP